MGKHSPAIKEIRQLVREKGYVSIGQHPDNDYVYICSNGEKDISFELIPNGQIPGLAGRILVEAREVPESMISEVKEILENRGYHVVLTDRTQTPEIKRPYER